MNITMNVEEMALRAPQQTALLFEGEAFSYAQLNELANRAANTFAALGVARGDRIALLLPNHPTFVTSYLGILKLGAIAVTINTALKAEEVQFILKDSEARVLVTSADLRPLLPALDEANRNLPSLEHILVTDSDDPHEQTLTALLTQASPHAAAVTMAPDEPAVILYTSGTTGFPKGALLSHQNIIATSHAAVATFEIKPEDRVLLCLPAFHSFGQTAVFIPAFVAGATLILHRQFEADPVLHSIQTSSVTHFFGVPTLYRLLQQKATPNQLSSIRRFICSGAPLPLELAHEWQQQYGRALNEGYGLSETCHSIFNHTPQAKPGSVGLPVVGVKVRIVNETGAIVAPDELGEVQIQSPSVMLGYWHRPAESAATIQDGWFHTGDIGRMDSDGYFYIVDRIKDMINVGGTKVYCSEVERILHQHPAVQEAAVYGIAEPLLGEQVCASIVLKPQQSVTPAALQAFCQTRLAEFKVPTWLDLVEELPKGRSGKILKRLLRDQAAVQHAQQIRTPQPMQQSSAAIQSWIADWLGRELKQSAQTIDLTLPFAQLGMTADLVMHLLRDVSEWLNYPLLSILAWQTPTVTALVTQLSGGEQHTHQTLQKLSGTERIALLEQYLRLEIAAALPVDAGVVLDKHTSLFTLGIDSLMAVRLKNKVQVDLGRLLPPTLLFSYPTLAALAAHLEQLILDAPPAERPLVKVDRTQPLPLSLTQQRLWFNQTVNRANSYTILSAFRLEGTLDLRALEQSINALIERHEVLRTIFPTINGAPCQVITTALPIKLVPIDLQHLSADEQNGAVEGLMQQEVQHLYDLATGPLLRITLAKLAHECHVLIFSFNHILIDAESEVQLFDELASLYGAFTVGESLQLPALPFQYADYAHWQHQSLPPALVATRVKYWVDRLTRDTPLFELDSDSARPARETFRSRIVPFQTTVAQTAQLKALQSTNGATLFTSVMAAWAALLYRYGKGEELVIGSPFSNRTHQELNGVVGHWGSMLLLPLCFHAQPTFLDLLQQVNQATQDAMINEVPIDQLVEALPAARKRNSLPHQFLLSFLPGKAAINLALPGVAVTAIESKARMVRPDLNFMVWEDQSMDASALVGRWVYKIELFEEESVVQMMQDFHSMLNAVLADPTCGVKDVWLPNLVMRNQQRTKES